MFFVVTCHLMSAFPAGEYSTLNGWLVNLYDGIGAFKVDGFVMITGYFMIGSRFKVLRFVKLFIEATLYVGLISLILKFVGPQPVSWGEVAKSFVILGPSKYNYWFITNYLALLALQPFIARMVRGLSRGRYLWLLGILLTLCTTLVTGFPFGYKFGGGFSFQWFLCLFLIGGYIRMHGFGRVHNNRLFWGIAFVVSVAAVTLSSRFLPTVVSLSYDSVLVVLAGISAFMLFVNIRIESPKVGRVSRHMLSVYIIHVHPLLLPVILALVSPLMPPVTSPWLVPAWILAGILVMAGCVVVDKLRMWLFEKLHIYECITSVSGSIETKLRNMLYK